MDRKDVFGMYRRIYLLIFILLLSVSVSGQTLVTVSGTTDLEDSWMDRTQPDVAYGTADTCRIQNAFTQQTSMIIRADVSSIPSGAVIVACTLRVYAEYVSASNTLASYRICKPWYENEVTWRRWRTGTAYDWQYGGAQSLGMTACAVCNNTGDGTGIDHEGTVSSSASFSSTGWVKVPVDTCHANAWLTGDDVNNGVNIEGGSIGAITTITSTEGSSNQPEWDFYYTEESGVPNARHSADGIPVRHSADGQSSRHPQ